MKGYHSYVFDETNRRFVGEFEQMYRAEAEQGFDSWRQEDLRNLTRRICLEVLAGYNFGAILDLGCGKGAFTQYLKKENNHVVAVDVSQAALRLARARYPDIHFLHADISAVEFDIGSLGKHFDLAVSLETLSYLENWPALVAQLARFAKYAMVELFLPQDPIGFVKSFDDLRSVVSTHFDIIEDIYLERRRQLIVFGKSRRDQSRKSI